MKGAWLMLTITLIGCNANELQESISKTDSVNVQPKVAQEIEIEESLSSAEEKIFSNKRFEHVTVESIGEHKFIVQGKAQIFEANFG